ncbi:MAG: HNH endonuclease [Thermodesulfovibrionales bacterium]|nr:HNH endonuclease [Thermodesulfovibrionales bacterium]
MTSNIYKKDFEQNFEKFNFHKKIDFWVRILTLGIFNNRDNAEKYLRLYNEAKADYDKYNYLINKAREMHESDSILLNGISVSKHTFSDTPVIRGEDYGINWESLRAMILSRDSHECQTADGYCNGPLQIHHIVPLSKGGTNRSNNLITLCYSHHCMKHEHMRGM